MEMENRNLKELMRELIVEFDDEKGKEFYEFVYDQYYATVAASFKDEVKEYCKVVLFGNEYALNVQELYAYDRYFAVESWRDYVNRSLEEDFHYWVEQVIDDDIEDFSNEFQQWLSKRDDDERAADAIVALMSEAVDLNEIIEDWLRYRLGYEDWEYPA